MRKGRDCDRMVSHTSCSARGIMPNCRGSEMSPCIVNVLPATGRRSRGNGAHLPLCDGGTASERQQTHTRRHLCPLHRTQTPPRSTPHTHPQQAEVPPPRTRPTAMRWGRTPGFGKQTRESRCIDRAQANTQDEVLIVCRPRLQGHTPTYPVKLVVLDAHAGADAVLEPCHLRALDRAQHHALAKLQLFFWNEGPKGK